MSYTVSNCKTVLIEVPKGAKSVKFPQDKDLEEAQIKGLYINLGSTGKELGVDGARLVTLNEAKAMRLRLYESPKTEMMDMPLCMLDTSTKPDPYFDIWLEGYSPVSSKIEIGVPLTEDSVIEMTFIFNN